MKISTLSLASLLSLSCTAWADTALSYHYGSITTSNSYVMQIQNIGEIVGLSSPLHELRYGLATLNDQGSSRAEAYAFIYTTPRKNDERGFGLGGAISGAPADSIPKFTLKLGGKVAYGWQPVKGESKVISTNINKLSYVTTPGVYDAFKTPTKMTYEEDTQLLSLTLVSGMGYDISRNLKIEAELAYSKAYYQFAYRNEGSSVLNSLSVDQDQWHTTCGIRYRF